jgi:hypothetical protein
MESGDGKTTPSVDLFLHLVVRAEGPNAMGIIVTGNLCECFALQWGTLAESKKLCPSERHSELRDALVRFPQSSSRLSVPGSQLGID